MISLNSVVEECWSEEKVLEIFV